MRAAPPSAWSRKNNAGIALLVARDPAAARLPRLHEVDPVQAGTTRSRRRSSPPTTSRRARRCGSRASRSARSPRSSAPTRAASAAIVTMRDRQGRPADPRRRARQDPPAHLPRGQLLRRPRAGHAGRAGDRGQRHDPDQPDRRPGPVRPAADLAAVRHARGPQDAARRVRQRASTRAAPRRSTARSRTGRPPTATRAIVNEASLGETEHDLSGYIKSAGATGGGAGPQPRAAQEPDHRLQHDRRRVRPRAGQPAARDRRAAAHAARRPARARPRSTTPSRRLRAFAADLRPGRAAPPRPRSTPRSRSSASCAAWSPRTSCAGWPPTCARRSRRSARVARESIPLAEQNRLLGELPERGRPAVVARTRSRTSSSRPQGPVYTEAPKAFPGLAGESRSGDANGQWFRVLAAGGTNLVQLAPGVFGTTTNADPRRPTRPSRRRARRWTRRSPARPRRTPTCAASQATRRQQWQADTSTQAVQGPLRARQGPRRRLARGPAQAGGPRRQAQGHRRGRDEGPDRPDRRRQAAVIAIRKHLKDFVAVVGLILVAGGRLRLHPQQPAAALPDRARPSRSCSRPSSRPRRPSSPARARPCASRACGSATSAASSSRTAARSCGWTSTASTRTWSTRTRPRCCGPRPA